jgi:hypothetical protein
VTTVAAREHEEIGRSLRTLGNKKRQLTAYTKALP